MITLSFLLCGRKEKKNSKRKDKKNSSLNIPQVKARRQIKCVVLSGKGQLNKKKMSLSWFVLYQFLKFPPCFLLLDNWWHPAHWHFYSCSCIFDGKILNISETKIIETI